MSDLQARILAKGKCVPIEIEDWSDIAKFTIRMISGAERNKIISTFNDDKTPTRANAAAYMVAVFLGNESGLRIFSDSDLEKVSGLPSTIIEQIIQAGTKLNLLSKKDADEEKKT